MSQVKIQGNASGTGIFTVAAPNSNTDRTLTLPDGAGTLDRLERAGNVLQVVSNTSSTQVTTTSTSYVTTGLTVSITPQFANSKILILTTFQAYASAGGLSSYFTLYRNGSEITSPEAFRMESQANAIAASCAISYLDSPATTSATSYTVYMKSQTSALTTYINLSGDKASITVMEIAQ